MRQSNKPSPRVRRITSPLDIRASVSPPAHGSQAGAVQTPEWPSSEPGSEPARFESGPVPASSRLHHEAHPELVPEPHAVEEREEPHAVEERNVWRMHDQDARRTREQDAWQGKDGLSDDGLDSESRLPAPGRSKLSIIRATYRRLTDHDIGLLAGGVAFYFLIALVPFVATAVSIWGLVADPAAMNSHLSALEVLLPSGAYELVAERLRAVAERSPQYLSWGAGLAALITLWSAKKGSDALVRAINIVYEDRERRKSFARAAMALLITLGAIITFVVLVAVAIVVPSVAELTFGDPRLVMTASYLRWPAMLLLMLIALAALYKLAPRQRLRFRLTSPGALFGTFGWLAASIGVGLYASNFNRYDETYGALGGVLLLVVWFWMSALFIIAGAALNAETGALRSRRPSWL